MSDEIDKTCPDCGGDGYTSKNDPFDPHDGGVCQNCPIQVQCETCEGIGLIMGSRVSETVKERKGCWVCKHLEWFEKDCYESSDPEGWYCDKNENSENFKTFPCNRKLKCQELIQEQPHE